MLLNKPISLFVSLAMLMHGFLIWGFDYDSIALPIETKPSRLFQLKIIADKEIIIVKPLANKSDTKPVKIQQPIRKIAAKPKVKPPVKKQPRIVRHTTTRATASIIPKPIKPAQGRPATHNQHPVANLTTTQRKIPALSKSASQSKSTTPSNAIQTKTTTKTIIAAEATFRPKPYYPARSRRRAQQGKVLLALQISAQGLVINSKIKQSSGHKALDNSALSTVTKQWKFKAASQQGKTISSWVNIPIRFSLDD